MRGRWWDLSRALALLLIVVFGAGCLAERVGHEAGAPCSSALGLCLEGLVCVDGTCREAGEGEGEGAEGEGAEGEGAEGEGAEGEGAEGEGAEGEGEGEGAEGEGEGEGAALFGFRYGPSRPCYDVVAGGPLPVAPRLESVATLTGARGFGPEVLVGDVAVYSDGDARKTIALDLTTGEPRWEKNSADALAPLDVVSDGRVVCGLNATTAPGEHLELVCYDLQDGRELRRANLDSGFAAGNEIERGTQVIEGMLFAHDLLFLSIGPLSGAKAPKIMALDPRANTPLARWETGANSTSVPFVPVGSITQNGTIGLEQWVVTLGEYTGAATGPWICNARLIADPVQWGFNASSTYPVWQEAETRNLAFALLWWSDSSALVLGRQQPPAATGAVVLKSQPGAELTDATAVHGTLLRDLGDAEVIAPLGGQLPDQHAYLLTSAGLSRWDTVSEEQRWNVAERSLGQAVRVHDDAIVVRGDGSDYALTSAGEPLTGPETEVLFYGDYAIGAGAIWRVER